MSHEMSKAHQNQVAEKAAIIANTAFGLGRTAERNRIIELLKENFCDCDSDNCKGWFLPDAESIIKKIIGEETNDGSN